MKKLLMPVLIAVILVQLLVPVSMIIGKYDTLRTGKEFKFKVYPIDPYDAFRGRYVSLNARQDVRGDGEYGIIAVDSDGYAYIETITDEKPKTGAYVKSSGRYGFSMPIDRYYMDERLAPKAESLTRQRDTDHISYVTARVKNGKLVLSGLFINDTAIEDLINNE